MTDTIRLSGRLADPGDAHMHDRPRPVVLATDGAL